MIGIVDSGIGGSTVLKEILKTVEPHTYFYYSDSKNNPYGNKKQKEVYKIVSTIVELLIEKGCLIIVLACNTASALCVDRLRKNYPHIHFIAIEPAYKMVHDYNKTEKTLIMATKNTLESRRFRNLYFRYNNHNTILYPCLGLAELIENNNQEGINNYIKENIIPFKGVHNIVLGCTHYPLIKKNIQKYLGKVTFFDGSHGVSMMLKGLLEKKGIPSEHKNKILFFDSSGSIQKEQLFFDIIYDKKNM